MTSESLFQALQISVPQIPEQQQQRLEVLRQKWLTAVQKRGTSGQVKLQDVANWLSGAGRTNSPMQQQVCPSHMPYVHHVQCSCDSESCDSERWPFAASMLYVPCLGSDIER